MIEMVSKKAKTALTVFAWIVLIWRAMHTSCTSSGALSHTIETIQTLKPSQRRTLVRRASRINRRSSLSSYLTPRQLKGLAADGFLFSRLLVTLEG